MNEITINNEVYIKKSEITTEYQPSPIQIVVLNRGWIVVGNVEEKDGKTSIGSTLQSIELLSLNP